MILCLRGSKYVQATHLHFYMKNITGCMRIKMRILPLKFLIQSLFLLFFPIYFCYRRLNEPFVQKTMKGSKLLFNIISKSFHYKLNWTNTINYLFPKKMGLIVKIKKKLIEERTSHFKSITFCCIFNPFTLLLLLIIH